MSNAVLPSFPGLMFDSTKTPTFNTRVQTAVSGREARAAFYSYPIWDFSLSYEFLRESVGEMQALAGFFMQRAGQFDSFLYLDPNDNSVTDAAIGIGNGSNKTFQLLRAFGGFSEPVMNVKTITNVKVGGVQTMAYTVNGSGVITFATAPASGAAVTWSGTFYFRCRFKQDTAEFSQFMWRLWELGTLEFRGCLGDKI